MNTKLNKLLLLGIPVDNVNMTQALDKIFEMIENYSIHKKQQLVATANVDFLINAYNKKAPEKANQLLHVLRNADMVTADGMPLVWLSKLLGEPLPERVTGADMVPKIAERCAKEGKSIYLLGGKSGAARETVAILQEKYPGLKIAGYDSPMIDIHDEAENKNIVARINIVKPDVLLIALGNPKQELWYDNNKKYLSVPVSIGVGGTFEFIAGMVSRAPKWIQTIGMEWFHRIIQDPKRLLKRYAVDLFRFSLMVMPLLMLQMAQRLKNKIGQNHNENNIEIRTIKDNLARITQLNINLKNKKYLAMNELVEIFQLLFSARQNEAKTIFQPLTKNQKQLLKANKLYDLIPVTEKNSEVEKIEYYTLNDKYLYGV